MKIKLSIFLGIFFLFFSASFVDASLLVVDSEGEIVWKVLSQEDGLALEIPTHSYIQIKEASEEKSIDNSTISLVKNEEKVSLVVASGNETKELDVSNWDEDLVEIEERGENQKLTLGVSDNKFVLEQKGIKAQTTFPFHVDAKKAQLSITTPSGDRFLSILPYQVVETLLRSKILNKVNDNKIDIVEKDQELQYLVNGEKVLNVLGIFEYSVPITTNLSASTGEILSIEAPIWYKAISFLFS